MTANQEAERVEEAFVAAFSSAFVKALTGASGSPWLVADVPEAEVTADGVEPVRMKLTLEGSLRGEAVLEFNRASAAVLASQFLRQASDEFGAEQSKALLKLTDAAVMGFRAEVALEHGAFTITVGSTSDPVPEGAKRRQITIADNASKRVSILMYMTPSLIEALSLPSELPGHTGISSEVMRAATEKANREHVNLNLVMDVELNVTLRFGQRQLTLREVLELASGSVVELDRQVEEPVELLLESKVIARGEAVVIDGNYGLRVTEVCHPINSLSLR